MEKGKNDQSFSTEKLIERKYPQNYNAEDILLFNHINQF